MPAADNDPRDPEDPSFPLLHTLHGKLFALEGKVWLVRMAVPRPVGLSQYVHGQPRTKLDPEPQPDSIALIAVPIGECANYESSSLSEGVHVTEISPC